MRGRGGGETLGGPDVMATPCTVGLMSHFCHQMGAAAEPRCDRWPHVMARLDRTAGQQSFRGKPRPPPTPPAAGKHLTDQTTPLKSDAPRKGDFQWSVPSAGSSASTSDEVRELGRFLCGRKLYETMLPWGDRPLEARRPGTSGLRRRVDRPAQVVFQPHH